MLKSSLTHKTYTKWQTPEVTCSEVPWALPSNLADTCYCLNNSAIQFWGGKWVHHLQIPYPAPVMGLQVSEPQKQGDLGAALWQIWRESFQMPLQGGMNDKRTHLAAEDGEWQCLHQLCRCTPIYRLLADPQMCLWLEEQGFNWEIVTGEGRRINSTAAMVEVVYFSN